MEQRIAVLVSAVFGLLLLAVFLYVARSASVAGNADEVAAASARWRRIALATFIVIATPLLTLSLMRMPYGGADDANAVVINATGNQWAWAVDSTSVSVGQPVRFMVTGSDVNHGFGIFDPGGRLVAQTQAMPGYTNVLRHTFKAPGTYRVLCLEYCGLGHHSMFAQIVVTGSVASAR
jgi:cytochrome c oxidase subunit 2